MASRIERLQYFIETLQSALGWQITVEKESEDDYTVYLHFSLAFRGKSWGDILRNYKYREVVLEMVRNKLYALWEEELEATGNPPSKAEDFKV